MRKGSFNFVFVLTVALLAMAGALAFAAQADAPSSDPNPSSSGAEASARTSAPVGGSATVLDIEGAIGPATSRYIERGMAAAQARGSKLIVLRMDTPGGLDTSMRDIIRAILASTIPVVSYVSPSGARAASAGTYIMYASHVAAMAPATNLGAATPVQIGGESSPTPERSSPEKSDDDSPAADSTAAPDGKPAGNEKSAKPADGKADGASKSDKPARDTSRLPREPGSAMERKVTNDAVAYIRGLAELRGRNADWAEDAVRNAASLQASVALSKNVIDLIARDIPDLLAQLDGRDIKLASGTVKLATRGFVIEHVQPDWRTQILSVITNPTIAYGLLLIGIYGLLLEGYNPGALLPGVVGAISLITALFAFQILSVNYAGLALIAVGIGMIIAEFFVPAFGSLGIGGLVAFVVGSIILFDSDTPGLNIGMPIIAAVATVGGLIVFGIAWLARRSMKQPVVTGTQTMLGATAEVFEDFSGKGTVRFGGELWNAMSRAPLRKGQGVRITHIDGLLLWVEPIEAG